MSKERKESRLIDVNLLLHYVESYGVPTKKDVIELIKIFPEASSKNSCPFCENYYNAEGCPHKYYCKRVMKDYYKNESE